MAATTAQEYLTTPEGDPTPFRYFQVITAYTPKGTRVRIRITYVSARLDDGRFEVYGYRYNARIGNSAATSCARRYLVSPLGWNLR